jgi:peptide/nickel transport system substrate-binding protein
MAGYVRGWRVAGSALMLLCASGTALAQKPGGVLKIQHFDSPASMSILEESTRASEQPMMAVFNNLVVYKQDVAQNSLDSVVPDLATGWSWSED